MPYSSLIAPASQTEPMNSRQVLNNAGGYVFQIDDWARLDRFLILGSDAATYYTSARKLTRENAEVVTRCINTDPARAINRIVEISVSGRAPKNDPAVFALALAVASDNLEARKLALAAVPHVCRISTHLFQFVDAARALGRGWGRAIKRAVASWYDDKPVSAVAFQAIKYRSREGYTHKRLLQTAHPDGNDSDATRTALYRWICEKEHNEAELPAIVRAHLKAMATEENAIFKTCQANNAIECLEFQSCDCPTESVSNSANVQRLVSLISEHRLPWEALPTWANTKPEIWTAMLPHLGLTALIRNLGNMSRVGAIAPLSKNEADIVGRISDDAALRKARVHPFAILLAMSVYGQGRGIKGSGTWTPSRPILDALDGAFYKAFANVEPTGKRHLIALDVSGSMTAPLMGSPLSCREASAALALVTMATELSTHVVGFTSGTRFSSMSTRAALTPLDISPRQRLTDAVKTVSNLPFGGTDCALPMLYALEQRIEVDVFQVITDNETWAGAIHPMKALQDYRRKMNIPAKLIVVGMTSSGFSIADPQDGGALDVVGFDAAAPVVMADFVR